ncbi:MAG: NADH-quinone oxidoreductase subunit K [Proteobacteria bacterium]|nr:NADH-quinone oxidoreductase subunit K [Pseudomonadota bacterium]
MESLLSLIVGLLYAAGLYLILERSLVRLIFGILLWSQATNLLVFTAAGLIGENPPLIGESGELVNSADPLPQALILTAIVIGFGVVSFTLVLSKKVYQWVKTDDLEQLSEGQE